MKSQFEDKVLTVFLEGRLDAYRAENAEKEIFDLINTNMPEKIVFDCSGLAYIASAGLRVLLKSGKKIPDVSIINTSREVYEILDTTGFTGMFDTKRKMREMSVEGCKIIGGGFSSDVYRYDRETVIKVFKGRVTLDRIYKETASAKKSFVAGIPTAIPYDVVRCNENYGTVFELIDADTLSQNFMDHPDRFDELMEKYNALISPKRAEPITVRLDTFSHRLCTHF